MSEIAAPVRGTPVAPVAADGADRSVPACDGDPAAAAPAGMAERIFAIIEICAAAGRPLGLAEIAAETGLPKSSLHRICARLVELGALDADGARYEVGVGLFALGALNPRLRRLRVVAMPYLHELVAHSGWVANLAVLRGGRALLVDEVFGPRPAMPKLIGATLPLHATALGKALLAGADAERSEELVATLPLRRFTTRTVATREALRAQVAAIAAGEPAISREEWRLGTVAVAAPIRTGDGTVAALALIGGRGERGIRSVRGPLLAAARDLAAALSSTSEGTETLRAPVPGGPGSAPPPEPPAEDRVEAA